MTTTFCSWCLKDIELKKVRKTALHHFCPSDHEGDPSECKNAFHMSIRKALRAAAKKKRRAAEAARNRDRAIGFDGRYEGPESNIVRSGPIDVRGYAAGLAD
jgi:hypothetical protein